MTLKEHKVIEAQVGEYSAVVEDGEVIQALPAPPKTEAGIKAYIQFLQEVLEAKERTKK
jgi:hypothetical protein